MTDLATTRITLASGMVLNVATGGTPGGEAIVFLHGFPESHRTWRAIAPAFAADHFVVAPDQRGFGASDKPAGVDSYRTELIVADLIELADALGLKQFTLVGHDWGGVIAWLAAMAHPDRVSRLVIVNAPHPLVFQRSLIESPAQRAASQYITAFRSPEMESSVAAMGLDAFFDWIFGRNADLAKMPDDERARTIADWSPPGALTAMLNWYRASNLVVPALDAIFETLDWSKLPFPPIRMPTLVVWAMADAALLPVQLDGLGALVDDLEVVEVPDTGHFIPWENPAPVIGAIRSFLQRGTGVE